MSRKIAVTMVVLTFAMTSSSYFIAKSVQAAEPATSSRDFVRLAPADIEWVAYPGLAGELGVKQAFLYGNPAEPGLYVLRIHFPPGVMSAPHSHPDDRVAVVLEGTWWSGTGTTFDPELTVPVGPGSYMLHPAGEMHFDGARGEDVILQIVGVGPGGKTLSDKDAPDFALFPLPAQP
ncbi:MAG: cupin domain-containing protein [Pseudomonadota bacterium]